MANHVLDAQAVLDNIHFSLERTDGAQKPFRMVISARGSGKSTAFWRKAYKYYNIDGRPIIVFRNMAADITEAYLNDQMGVINKFLPPDDRIEYTWRKKDADRGCVDVRLNGKIFFRVLALNSPISRNKSLFMRNTRFVLYDEFIVDLERGEKYVTGTAERFRTIVDTFMRETPDLVCYFFGNIYSLYNPIFVWLNVDFNILKPGIFYIGDIYSLEWYELTPELLEERKKSPIYARSDDYTKMALYGLPMSDRNIRLLKKCPADFFLRFVFKIDGKYLAVYRAKGNKFYEDLKYWVCMPEKVGKDRKITVFNFFDLERNAVLFDSRDRVEFASFKAAARNREIAFENVACNYAVQGLYNKL